LKLIASEAAKLSVQLVRNEKPAFNAKYNNGFKEVDSVFLKPIALTKSNVDLVIKDGFYTQAQLSGK
jgi:D-xylose transport system substrate-binding protein